MKQEERMYSKQELLYFVKEAFEMGKKYYTSKHLENWFKDKTK
jgi:hypothetical protein